MSSKNIDNSAKYNMRKTQALELGICISEKETIESLELKILSKLNEGMSIMKDIVDQIELIDSKSLEK